MLDGEFDPPPSPPQTLISFSQVLIVGARITTCWTFWDLIEPGSWLPITNAGRRPSAKEAASPGNYESSKQLSTCKDF